MAQDSERSFSEIVETIVGDVQGIVRAEVRLAKAEVREEAAKIINASKLLGAGALLGLYALGLVLLTLLFALETILLPWLSALILAVLIGTAAAVLLGRGKKRLRQVDPKPDKTIRTIKENVEWVKHQTR
jgi:uncharacterized membrane protein YqjE